MASINDQQTNAVLSAILDNNGLNGYAHDLFTRIDAEGKSVVSISSFGDFAEQTSMASTSNSTPTARDLAIAVATTRLVQPAFVESQMIQNLNGDYLEQLGKKSFSQIKSLVEKEILRYLATSVASGSADSFNAEAGANLILSASDLRDAQASLMSMPGSDKNRFLWILEPYASGKVRNLSSFTGQNDNVVGDLGISYIGRFDGIPVIESQGLPGAMGNLVSWSATTTPALSAVVNTASGTLFTISGHGMVSGLPFQTTGLSTNAFGTGAIGTVVSPTQLHVVGVSASAGQQAGTLGSAALTLNASISLLVSRDHTYYVPESAIEFRVKMVDRTDAMGKLLQVANLYGRDAWVVSVGGTDRAYVKRLFSPITSSL